MTPLPTKSLKQILVYADSLTWGIIPGTRQRLVFHARWPGVLENTLLKAGLPVRVFENCLNGRRTVWEDPFLAGRNGLVHLEQVIEMHSPLDLVILMLGTNDFQSVHAHHTAWHSAQGIGCLIEAIRRAPVEPGMPIPPVLVLIPPAIQTPEAAVMSKFIGSATRSAGLAQAYREMADHHGCAVFDANTVVVSSKIDGIHLDEDQHTLLGNALAQCVQAMLS